MTRAPAVRVTLLPLALALWTGVVSAGGTEPASQPSGRPALASTRALVAQLGKSGRGEAPVTVSRGDPLGGPDHVDQGRLTLEPPDRVRLDFASTGERIALRGDGGEWIQPAAHQMVKIRREQAGLATWLWEVFLAGGADTFSERVAGERRYRLEPRDRNAALPGQILIATDSGGLPAEVRFTESDGTETRYRFHGWSFRAAKGAKSFMLSAPRGYATVDLP